MISGPVSAGATTTRSEASDTKPDAFSTAVSTSDADGRGGGSVGSGGWIWGPVTKPGPLD